MPRKKLPAAKAFLQLETEVAPRDLDLALGLLFQRGITTTQTRRRRQGVFLFAELPKGFQFSAFRKSILAMERVPGGRRVFKDFRCRRITDRSWIDKYKKHLRPFPLLSVASGFGKSLTVDPRGTLPRCRDPETLYIEAGLAFGTGTHTTTQLAAEFLAEALDKAKTASVLDVGCGTGILAMTAKKLGAKRVCAVDNDPEALQVARENLSRNGIRGVRLTASLAPVREKFSVIVSNIGLNVLVDLQGELLKRLAPQGTLILTGLLYKDRPALRRAYQKLKLLRAENRRGWSAFLLKKD